MSTSKNPKHISETPFLMHWKHSLIEQARDYDLPIEPESPIDYEALQHTIFDHELELIRLGLRTVVDQNNFIGEWELELLKKARQFRIPYKPRDIDWDKLSRIIEDYEELMALAAKHDVEWNYDFYDPICLQQEIENILQTRHKESIYYRHFFPC